TAIFHLDKSTLEIHSLPHAVLLLVAHSPFSDQVMSRGAMFDVQLRMDCKMRQAPIWNAVESGQSFGHFHSFAASARAAILVEVHRRAFQPAVVSGVVHPGVDQQS